MNCPYCDGQMEEKDSSEIYNGRSFGAILLCSNYPECDARVSMRNGEPLGTPARHALRELRKQCHAKFDPLWKNGEMSRSEAYEFLRGLMRFRDPQRAHIARFNEEDCHRFLGRFDCRTCRMILDGFGPSHEGSRSCYNAQAGRGGAIAAGGTSSHCTCDACF